MASSVADSKSMQLAASELHARFFQDADVGAEDLAQHLDSQPLPTSMVPVHGALLRSCENLITKLSSEMEPYRFDYPGLARVFLSVDRFFYNFVYGYKDSVRDPAWWNDAAVSLYKEDGSTIESPRELQTRLAETITSEWFQQSVEEGHRQIARKLLDLVDLVAKVYLAKTEQELLDARKRERAEQFEPIEHSELITDTLSEAYKGLRWVLGDQDQLTYHSLVREVRELSN